MISWIYSKCGLKILPNKCQFFKKKIVHMGLEFQVQNSKVCYTPMKDKLLGILNYQTLKQTRTTFCGMVNFL